MRQSIQDFIIKQVQNEVAVKCIVDHCGIIEAWSKTIQGELLPSKAMHGAWMRAMYGATENQFWTLYSGAMRRMVMTAMDKCQLHHEQGLKHDPIPQFLEMAIPHVVSLLDNGMLNGYEGSAKAVRDFFKGDN